MGTVMSCVSNIMYLSEKITLWLTCIGLVSCIVLTLVVTLGLGIGIGYNYCFVDLKTRYKVPSRYRSARWSYPYTPNEPPEGEPTPEEIIEYQKWVATSTTTDAKLRAETTEITETTIIEPTVTETEPTETRPDAPEEKEYSNTDVNETGNEEGGRGGKDYGDLGGRKDEEEFIVRAGGKGRQAYGDQAASKDGQDYGDQGGGQSGQDYVNLSSRRGGRDYGESGRDGQDYGGLDYGKKRVKKLTIPVSGKDLKSLSKLKPENITGNDVLQVTT